MVEPKVVLVHWALQLEGGLRVAAMNQGQVPSLQVTRGDA